MVATIESRPLTKTALIALLRQTVPCPTRDDQDDALIRDVYERALIDWADKKPWERDIVGFHKTLADELSTIL